MSIKSRAAAAAVTLVVLIGAACTAPSTPGTAPDGGPIPAGTTYRTTSLTPADAPDLLAKMTVAVNDPAFAELLDPANRDAVLAAMARLVTAPDALDQIRSILARVNDADARQNATGRLPAPVTDNQLRSANVPSDQISAFRQLPSAAPPTTLPPQEATTPAQTQLAGAALPPSAAVPEGLHTTSVTPTGDTSPTNSPNAWPVVSGTRSQNLFERLALYQPTGGPTFDVTPKDCGVSNTGTRHLPADPVPAYTGRIFTPAQGTIASTDQPTGRTPGSVVTYTGDLQTRMDPNGTGIRQFKVEANLLSPVSYNGQLVRPDVFQGHILVSRFGESQKESYFPNSPHTEWHTYCYAEDLGLNDVHRAYVEAWVPMDQTTPGAGPSVGDVDEPGFQVRFETVDNCWDTLGNCRPVYFYGADQATVELQRTSGPLAFDQTVPGGSLSARVSDKVLVDRDQDPTNDLESLLKSQILPQVGPALESIDGAHLEVPALLYADVLSVHAYNWDLDLDIKPIANDDESELTAAAGFHALRIYGVYAIGISECPFRADFAADVSAKARVNLKKGDASKLDLGVTSSVANVGISNVVIYNVLDPTCLITGLEMNNLASSVATSEANDHIAPIVNTQLTAPVQLQVGDVVKPGAGSRFDTGLTSFERSCTPRGCQGGDELLDKDGLAIVADLNVKDAKSPNDPRRFPYVFSPSLTPTLADQYVPHPLTDPLTNPDGREYLAAVAVHPATVNQVLRAITEGNGAADKGVLGTTAQGFDMSAPVAPFTVNQAVLPNLPALTVFFPDLRAHTDLGSDSDSLFSVNAVVGVDLKVDANSRSLVPKATTGVEFNTLRCGWDLNPSLFPRQYDLCADTSWEGGKLPSLPSVPQLFGLVVNTLVPAALTDSFGEIKIPKLQGSFDLTALGDSEVRNVDGYLTVFLGMKPIPGVDISATSDRAQNSLTVLSEAHGLPGVGPVTYDVEVDDLNNPNYMFHPAASTNGTLVDFFSNYSSYVSKYSIKPVHVLVKVTATRNNVSVTASKDLVVP